MPDPIDTEKPRDQILPVLLQAQEERRNETTEVVACSQTKETPAPSDSQSLSKQGGIKVLVVEGQRHHPAKTQEPIKMKPLN
jgi:hypothetical protein